MDLDFFGNLKNRDDRNKYGLSCQTSQTQTETGSSLQPIQVTFRFNLGADNLFLTPLVERCDGDGDYLEKKQTVG